jgi:hypothetical protein
MIHLNTSGRLWSALIGRLNGNRATLTTVEGAGIVQFSGTVTFTSPTKATVVQNSCYPLYQNIVCAFDNGVPVEIRKIW